MTSPTLIFDSLAVRPFTHAALGDLSKIHEPNINVVVGVRTLSQDSIAYLDNHVDVNALTRAPTADTPFGVDYKFRLGGHALKKEKILQGVASVFLSILPCGDGRDALVEDTALILRDLSDAYRGRVISHKKSLWKSRYSGDIDFVLIANGVGSIGGFHRDNFAEHRSLITLKGATTLCADDVVRTEVDLPGAFLDRENNPTPKRNNYGSATPTAEFAHLIRRAPSGQILVWCGDFTEMPFIHSEHPVWRPEDTRLTLMAVPHEMNVQEYKRNCAYYARARL